MKYLNYARARSIDRRVGDLPRRLWCGHAANNKDRQIFSTKGGYFVVRFAIPHCDEEVQSLFKRELACFGDESEALRPTIWQ